MRVSWSAPVALPAICVHKLQQTSELAKASVAQKACVASAKTMRLANSYNNKSQYEFVHLSWVIEVESSDVSRPGCTSAVTSVHISL